MATLAEDNKILCGPSLVATADIPSCMSDFLTLSGDKTCSLRGMTAKGERCIVAATHQNVNKGSPSAFLETHYILQKFALIHDA